MSINSYKDAVGWLFHQFPAYQQKGVVAYKPNLDNIIELIEKLGIETNQLKFIHVAGTNGKGSTCAIIASTLTEAGFKTGLFTSPHIKDFRERIRINGQMISKEKVLDFVLMIKNSNLLIKPSFFELSWALALVYFIENKTDFIVVETGLGGRLDATNIILPILSIITNIGLDHTSILGDTRAKIAIEKAGIIKEKVPVLIGENDDELKAIFNSIAKKNNAPIHFLEYNSKSDFMHCNKQLAKTAVSLMVAKGYKITEGDFLRGLKNLYVNTGQRARFEKISDSPLIIVDAAHNEDGVKALFKLLSNKYPSKTLYLIYGASKDKSIQSIINQFPSQAVCFFTTFKNERSFTIDNLKNQTKKLKQEKYYFTSVNNALTKAKTYTSERSLIVIFGSFFLLDDLF